MRFSLSNNQLCGRHEYDSGRAAAIVIGTYTTEGIVAICDMLKLNRSLTSLSYASHSLNSSPKCQDPLTVLAFCLIVSPRIGSAMEAR